MGFILVKHTGDTGIRLIFRLNPTKRSGTSDVLKDSLRHWWRLCTSVLPCTVLDSWSIIRDYYGPRPPTCYYIIYICLSSRTLTTPGHLPIKIRPLTKTDQ